jgi:hypothetical protein
LDNGVARAPVLLAALGAVALTLGAGCLEPFRAHVPEDLAQGWTVTAGGVQGGFLGPKSRETRYALDRDPDAPPPFSGSLQVFSIRSLGALDSDRLLDLARDLVGKGAQENAIELADGEAGGSRTLRSGVPTHWFAREGRTSQAGDLFDQDVQVRILGEAGHDGRSDTSVLLIAMAQVGRTNQCPLLPTACQPEETDLRTWLQMVGDERGSVQGATSSDGFIDHLVTR